MDRTLVYPGAIPLETDILTPQRFAMLGLAYLAQTMLGNSSQIVYGLSTQQTSPASMQVSVGAGAFYQLMVVDATAYSSLASDNAHQVLKQAIMMDPTLLTLAAPPTSGHSWNYLIQATSQEVDAGSLVLPYYNAADPAQAWSGPNNDGTPQYTQRLCKVIISAKQGASAPTGSQVTPSPDSGYLSLAVVTVANGASSITSGNITLYPSPTVVVNEFLQQKISKATADTLYTSQSFVAATYATIASLASYATLSYANSTFAPIGSIAPVGTVAWFPTSSLPTGWTELDGALLNRTTYAALWTFAQSGFLVSEATWSSSSWGSFSTGDLSTTFRKPDLRGEFVRGYDNGRGVDSGRTAGTFQSDLLKNHTHLVTGDQFGITYSLGAGFANTTVTGNQASVASANPSGGLGGAETRPRNVALVFAIKYA